MSDETPGEVFGAPGIAGGAEGNAKDVAAFFDAKNPMVEAMGVSTVGASAQADEEEDLAPLPSDGGVDSDAMPEAGTGEVFDPRRVRAALAAAEPEPARPVASRPQAVPRPQPVVERRHAPAHAARTMTLAEFRARLSSPSAPPTRRPAAAPRRAVEESTDDDSPLGLSALLG